MIKKVLIISLLVFLCACTNTSNIEENVEDLKYIDSINDVFIFDKIDKSLKDRISYANGNSEFDNYQFKMLNKKGYDKQLFDIYGNSINLKDIGTYLLDVVSVDCKHCRNMIKEHLNEMCSSDIQLIQYFNIGTKSEIIDLYKELEIDIPNNIIIIEHYDDFDDYIRDYLKLEMYPSLICFYDNKVSFNEHGDIEESELLSLYDIGFVNRLSYVDEGDEKLEHLINSSRTKDDVLSSLSQNNIDKLKKLDSDELSLDYSLRIMGNELDFDNISNEKSTTFINEIDDYSYYLDKDVVIIYTSFSSENEVDKINFINNLISRNSEVEYIVTLIEGIDSSSGYYVKMNSEFNCKVTSVLGYTPDDFFKVGISKYPTAFFVKKGTFTGAHANINDLDKFEDAIDMFLGKECIALKTNN